MVSKEELPRNAATQTKNVKGCLNESALVALEDKDGICSLKKRRVRKPEYSLKSQSGISVKPHCMKTRNHKAGKKEPQNEGVTIAQSEKVCKGSWNLEEEIAKVIKMGVVLGFDFNDKEKELVKVLRRREKEDVGRLQNAGV
ncbi:hypothetical protein LWI29_001961 [Acer saccharum]|uniref:Uncharacterized protein n=1 Tax=Acer saccharum TaxID=4024 RepID=A0AA39SS21_ACESA|nr:hypothetical protein LWI29_001961 [Acer saccharum]